MKISKDLDLPDTPFPSTYVEPAVRRGVNMNEDKAFWDSFFDSWTSALAAKTFWDSFPVADEDGWIPG